MISWRNQLWDDDESLHWLSRPIAGGTAVSRTRSPMVIRSRGRTLLESPTAWCSRSLPRRHKTGPRYGKELVVYTRISERRRACRLWLEMACSDFMRSATPEDVMHTSKWTTRIMNSKIYVQQFAARTINWRVNLRNLVKTCMPTSDNV